MINKEQFLLAIYKITVAEFPDEQLAFEVAATKIFDSLESGVPKTQQTKTEHFEFGESIVEIIGLVGTLTGLYQGLKEIAESMFKCNKSGFALRFFWG